MSFTNFFQPISLFQNILLQYDPSKMTHMEWSAFSRAEYTGAVFLFFNSLPGGTNPSNQPIQNLLEKCTPQSGLGIISLLAKNILKIKHEGPTPHLIPARNPEDFSTRISLTAREESALKDLSEAIRKIQDTEELDPSLAAHLILGIKTEIIEQRFNLKEIDLSSYVFFAVEHEQEEILKTLKTLGANLNARCELYSNTPAHKATERGQVNMLRALHNLGADLSLKNAFKETLLHWAAADGQVDVIKFLKEINIFSHPNSQTPKGDTPAHYVASISNRNSFDSLDETGISLEFKVLEALNEIGTGLDHTKYKEGGLAPIHTAAKKGNEQMIKALLSLGVSPDLPGAHGETPAHHAAFSWQINILKVLHEHGANLRAKDRRGTTPYMDALWGNKNSIWGNDPFLNFFEDQRKKETLQFLRSLETNT